MTMIANSAHETIEQACARVASLCSLADILSAPVCLPDKKAVDDGRIAYSFSQLDELSRSIAHAFVAQGLRKGDRVFVLAEKCSEIVVIALAIWKAGAVYVPVDVENPAPRVELMFRSIAPRLVIGPSRLINSFSSIWREVPRLHLELINDIGKEAIPTPLPRVASGDVAYIMHTSGSTGTPKGVVMSHGSILTYFAGHNQVLCINGASRCLNNAPFHFDVSIQDTFLPLAFGATVYLTRGLPVGALLLRTIERERITHLIAVATILTIITGDGRRLAKTDLSALEVVMTGAEVCDVKVINAWLRHAPSVRVINGYGPTEVNSISLTYTITEANEQRTEFYPIGKPLSTVRAVLIGGAGNLITAAGEVGELLLGGPQLMNGYWNNPDETGKAFTVIDGDRYYRTGDLCHLDHQGNFVFDGRRDAEIKLAGRRVNLTEVQQCLLKHPCVSAATVGVASIDGRSAVAALIIPRSPMAIKDLKQVKRFAAARLPDYMVPTYLAVYEHAVLLASGKTDQRRLLRALEQEISEARAEFYRVDENLVCTPIGTVADIITQ